MGGNDALFGLGGDDMLYGGAGDDVLDGGAGADILNGEEGTADVATYANASASVVVDLANASVRAGRGAGDAAGDTFTGIEIIQGSAYSDYFYAGGTATNLIYRGGAGSNNITVNNSVFKGDTVDFSSSGAAVKVDLAVDIEGSAGATGGAAQGAQFTGIENLVGSSNDDTLKGDANTNVVWGGGGDDVLKGSLGNITTTSSTTNGVTTVTTVIDADTFDGGSNTSGNALSGDTLSYEDFVADNFITVDMSATANAQGFLTVSIARGTTQAPKTQTDLFTNIENIRGSQGNDAITGDKEANRLEGMAGDDSLSGGKGKDTLMGGEGNDTLEGGEGADELDGGQHGTPSTSAVLTTATKNADWASYANAADRSADVGVKTGVTVSGVVVNLANAKTNEGDAEGDTYVGIENLRGSAFDDQLTGDDNANWIEGGAGKDTLQGGKGDDYLDGGTGDDLLLSGEGADEFWGGTDANAQDTDTVSYAAIATTTGLEIDLRNTTKGGGKSTANSEAFGDVIGTDIEKVVGASGTGGTTFLSGNRAIPTGKTVPHTLTLDGNTLQENWVSYVNATSEVKAYLSSTMQSSNASGATGDRYANIQNLRGSDFTLAGDILMGDEKANVLYGGNGADTLMASLGEDKLYGGTDTLDDNTTDTVSFAGTALDVSKASISIFNGVTISLANAAAQTLNFNSANTDVTAATKATVILSGIENIIGSSGNDSLTGDTGANSLDGGLGNDTLNGGDGSDTLVGGAGADSFFGGADADGKDTDVVSYQSVTSAITIDLAYDGKAGSTSKGTGEAANDLIDGTVETVWGSKTASNTFYGRAAAETLLGGNANDTIYGSDGADSIDGGGGTDTVDYSSSTAITIDLGAGGNNTGGHAAGDTLINIEKIIGTAKADSIKANSSSTVAMTFEGRGGNDTLTGGAGSDSLDGGDDNDSLTGGAGNDSLVAGDGSDTLVGGDGDDTLDLSAAKGNSSLSGDSASGEAGNDTVLVDQSLGNPTTVDGGAGTDTLRFKASVSGSLNLGTLGSYYKNFEVLDLSQDGVDSKVQLSVAGIAAFAGGSSITLKLGASDTVEFLNPISYDYQTNRVYLDAGSGSTATFTIQYV